MLKKTTEQSFCNIFKEYYSTLKLGYPDRIVSNELEAVGEKALYEEWLEILAQKKVKISYGKSAQGKELQMLADKNAKVLLDNAKIKKWHQFMKILTKSVHI